MKEYYKIRLIDNVGKHNEWHASDHGNDVWRSLDRVMAYLANRSIERYEVHKFTETVTVRHEKVET